MEAGYVFQTLPLFNANLNAEERTVVNQGGTSSGKTYSIMQVLFFLSMQEGGLVTETYTEDYFLGTVTVDAGKNAVQTTLAYDKGWNVYVDGEQVETYQTLDALLAFDVEEGEHTIEMRYFPKEYKFSLILFAGGCAMFLAILVWDHVRTVKKKKAAAALSAAKEPSETEEDPDTFQADGTSDTVSDNDDQPKGT